MARKEEFTAAQIIAAVQAAGGLINLAAAKLGCDWHTVKRYIDTYPKVKAAYEAANELQLDRSEGTLFTLRDGSKDDKVKLRAAEFHLSKKGRGRGYGDRLTIETIDVSNMTDDQLAAIAAGKDPNTVRE